MHIAYTVLGDGPIDLVYTNGIWSNLEALWEEPRWVRYAERLASFSRLIVFDMRGVGLSDRGGEPPFLELMVEDAGAVMDAASSETAALFGASRAGVMAMLFAATHPERVRALVLYGTFAKNLRSDDHPYGATTAEDDAFVNRFVAEMGTAQNLDLQAPSGLGDERFVRWWARFERLITSPAGFRELADVRRNSDVRAVLPLIQAPTLVLHRAGDRIVPVDQGRYLGEAIPNAKFVELAGDDHIPFVGDADAI
ncbi:MAG TPA: alpha/beta fold hydrolase, partial [Terriglobia bacterium]|nr:alpha/beta fold hydrolase [Terriglobia bacterium]